VLERVGDRQGLVHLYADLATSYAVYGNSAAAQRSIGRAFALADQEQMQTSYIYVILLETRCWIHILDRRADAARTDLANVKRLRTALSIEADPGTFVREARLELIEGRIQRVLECCEESLASGERQGITRVRGPSIQLLATAHLILGNLELAVNALHEVTEMEMEAMESERSQEDIPELFWIGAAIAAVRAHPRTAARLWGFAKATWPGLDPLRPPEIEVSNNITLESLRDQLTPSALEGFAAEGSRLDLNGALEELSQIS
jgi:hypothetical protein